MMKRPWFTYIDTPWNLYSLPPTCGFQLNLPPLSHNMASNRRNHSITSLSICIFINPKSLARIWIISHRLALLFIPPRAYTPIVNLSPLCRAHKLGLKRVDKHSGLVLWESGDLILCHYLAGPASRHLLVNAVFREHWENCRYGG